MPIPYKKPYSQGRRSTSGGPRDQQRRQSQESLIVYDQNDLIESLKEQIKLLKNRQETKLFTNKQIDDEIIKVVKEETVKYKERITELENENNVLKNNLQNKDALIEQLKQVKNLDNEVVIEKSGRPKMEKAFVDPIEKDFNDVELHIETKETVGMSKEDVAGKVDKLKKLLGKV